MKNTWQIISVIFLAWAIVGSIFAANYYQISQQQQTIIDNLATGTIIRANLAINYGNGTVVWFNNTLIPYDYTLLNLTQKVATVNYTISGTDVFVNSINDVQGGTGGKWWVYDVWNGTAWDIVWISCNKLVIHYNDIVMWSLKQF
ncbi:MAG: hypothetical protein LUQ00_03050 [Candidatus Methanomethyliaceae archaeon]|nr:hypothetical protein [Candidatus Methanomethyliaceae archaeon]